MNNNMRYLLLAQFLSAFADNAILFTAIAMILKTGLGGDTYTSILQGSLLIPFVLLAPWIGPYADKQPKTRVLMLANIIKMVGAALMLLHVSPLIAYGIIGIGAAIYSPAKYGILPELVDHSHLVKANGWIEGSTLLAILAGGIVGGAIADHSPFLAIVLTIVLYIVAAALALLIRNTFIAKAESHPALPHFISMMRTLLHSPRARFATLGVSLFWAAGVVIRVGIVAWAPLVLGMTNSEDIAKLSVALVIGIAVGTQCAPFLIPLEKLRTARLAAYAMGLFVMLFAYATTLEMTYATLALIGLCGGIFVVPINAALQEIGHQTIGSGGAVAIQGFFENLAMLIATGIFAVAMAMHISPVIALFSLGLLVMMFTAVVALQLPETNT
jgi:LPLT family lysophospholipid transporter-like MFS transporter